MLDFSCNLRRLPPAHAPFPDHVTVQGTRQVRTYTFRCSGHEQLSACGGTCPIRPAPGARYAPLRFLPPLPDPGCHQRSACPEHILPDPCSVCLWDGAGHRAQPKPMAIQFPSRRSGPGVWHSVCGPESRRYAFPQPCSVPSTVPCLSPVALQVCGLPASRTELGT